MKEFAKYFARRYSAVNCDGDQHHHDNSHHQVTGVAGLQNVISSTTPMERHKSLQAQRSMNPSGILNTFFNKRKKNHRARSPTCKYYLD